MRPVRVLAAVLLSGSFASSRAKGPADDLLRLVPPDAGATIAVEGLREHSRAFLGSPLFERLKALPAIKSWYDAKGREQFDAVRRDIEMGLGVELSTIRDDLLGEAVVLALRVGPDEPPDRARGLLLTRFRDRALLDRLISSVNEAEKADGSLRSVVERTQSRVTYSVREFRPGTKPTEAYAILDGNIFAWSNSEALVREAIERRVSGQPGLPDDPRFRKVRAGLPARSIASLFVDPAFLARMAAADPKPEADDAGGAILRRYLRAVDYVGASLEWRGGPILHVHEAIDPERLGEPWKSWAVRAGGADALLDRLPTGATAFLSGPVDVPGLLDALLELVPESDRDKRDNLLVAARGMLLDRDPRTEVARFLGPGVLAYLDEPVGSGDALQVPFVLAIEVGGVPGVAAAVENGLRTVLALAAMDPKRGNPPPRVETRTIDAVRVTSLGGDRPIAFAVQDGILVLSNAPRSVAGLFARRRGKGPGGGFGAIRAEYFPKATAFAYADLAGLLRWAGAHRDDLARHLAAEPGPPKPDDLDHVLGLLGLFRAGFAASEVAPDSRSAHRTIGLIAADPSRD